MTKLCLLSHSLHNDTVLTSSFKTDCNVINYTEENNNTVLTGVDFTDVTHLGLFYHFHGHYNVPFFRQQEEVIPSQDDPAPEPKDPYSYGYRFFSDLLIDKIKEIRDASNHSLIVDLVSCDLNNSEFAAKVAAIESDLGINIRYSIDKTGNNPNGNWVMESDGANVKDDYFTSSIDAWTKVLNNGKDIDNYDVLFGGTSGDGPVYEDANFIRNETTKTLTLKGDINWTTVAGSVTYFINMKDGWTFDGAGYTITINTIATSFGGLFAIDVGVTTVGQRPTIKNLTLKQSSGNALTVGYADGWFLPTDQKFFVLDNCETHADCTTSNKGGMLCGRNAGHDGGDCLIVNCTNNGDIDEWNSGGIVGEQAGAAVTSDGKCVIRNCKNYGNITGNYAGGIAAYRGGYKSGGFLEIHNCTNYGDMNTGFGTGGIVGDYAASNYGKCTIVGCRNEGDINYSGSGGIAARYAADNNGTMVINGCSNIGSIAGSGGGIVGANAAQNSGTLTIKNSYNEGTINNFGGGLVGAYANFNTTSNGTINLLRCYCKTNITTGSAGGMFAINASGNITIDQCYFVGDITGNSATGCFTSSVAYGSTTEAKSCDIKITNSYVINTHLSNTAANGAGFFTHVKADTYCKILVSHCYVYNLENGLMNSATIHGPNTYIILNNCYTYGSAEANYTNICKLKDGANVNNDQLAIINCYTATGSGSEDTPKYGDTSSGGAHTGNAVYDNITSGTFADDWLNNPLTLNTINTIWSGGGDFSAFDITPPAGDDLFVYDNGVLLSKFQDEPWSSYTAYNSEPTLTAVKEETVTVAKTPATTTTIPAGAHITHIFANEAAYVAWLETGAGHPTEIDDIPVVESAAKIQAVDFPSSVAKSFITDKSEVIITTDSGDVTYVFAEEVGNSYPVVSGGNNFILRFTFAGSGGLDITPDGAGGGESGGDPHIIPIMQPGKILTLPCDKHGMYYNYLNYCNGKEQLTINVMTWLVRFNTKNKHLLSPEIQEYIKDTHSYVRYMMIYYFNEKGSEQICYDLKKMETVDCKVNNFNKLALSCRLPFKKYETDRIKVSDIYNSNNESFIKYKTNNSPQRDFTIYTDAAKFVLTVGNAEDHIIFDNYVKLKQYPKSLLSKGGGLLVSCEEEEMKKFVIKSLNH